MAEPCHACGLALLEECNERGYVVDLATRSATRCPNYTKGAASRAVAATGIPPRFADARLGTFEVKGLQGERQLAAAREACIAFVRSPVSGLLLWGPPGVGKSHLLSATLKATLSEHADLSGRFVEFTALCAKIQATFQDGYDGPREEEILGPLYGTSVLVLDELGARRPSPFARDTLYLLINHLYNHRTPILVSTNYDPDLTGKGGLLEQIGEPRILSRLAEMCTTVPMDRCADYRKRSKLTP